MDERESDNDYSEEGKHRVKSAAKRSRKRSSTVSADASDHSKKQKITNAGAAGPRKRQHMRK